MDSGSLSPTEMVAEMVVLAVEYRRGLGIRRRVSGREVKEIFLEEKAFGGRREEVAAAEEIRREDGDGISLEMVREAAIAIPQRAEREFWVGWRG